LAQLYKTYRDFHIELLFSIVRSIAISSERNFYPYSRDW